MMFYSEKEAIDEGLIQLYEYQQHTKDEEQWMQKEEDRIHLNPLRKTRLVKKGIYITLFVDDTARRIIWP